MAWARTYLKKAGLLHSHSRGLWEATAQGRQAGPIDAVALAAEIARTSKAASTANDQMEGFELSDEEPEPRPVLATDDIVGLVEARESACEVAT
jgi:restriction endonuclease Mrr